jgi:hypothetical protein
VVGNQNSPSGYGGIVAGIFDLDFAATDPGGLSATATTYVVVYDPDGGFAAGGGWIWSEDGETETVVCDNGIDQAIGCGNIVVHTKK